MCGKIISQIVSGKEKISDKKKWAGFNITCGKCGSDDIILEDSTDWDIEDGAWGDLSLVCNSCNNAVKIYELS